MEITYVTVERLDAAASGTLEVRAVPEFSPARPHMVGVFLVSTARPQCSRPFRQQECPDDSPCARWAGPPPSEGRHSPGFRYVPRQTAALHAEHHPPHPLPDVFAPVLASPAKIIEMAPRLPAHVAARPAQAPERHAAAGPSRPPRASPFLPPIDPPDAERGHRGQ